jgi:SAM-dependent methyltransferase
MRHLFRRAVLLVLGFSAFVLLWRWASRKRALPCPTWLAWMIEGSWVDRLLGTSTTLDRMRLQAGQHVLEIGPGPGRLLIPAAKRVLPGGDVTGVDIQAGMLERLKEHAEQAGVSNLTTVLGDITQISIQPEHFERVYLCTVLGEITDRVAALQKSYAALKPNGILSITEIFPDPHYQSRSGVKGLAQSAGFQPLESVGPWWFFTSNFIKPEAAD